MPDGPISHHLDLYGYWLAKRDSRAMAARRDIDPADIPLLLPYLGIVEKAEDQFRYRLIGSAITRRVGSDATGKCVGAALGPGAAAEMCAVYERAFRIARPVFSTGAVPLKPSISLAGSLLVLPLSDDGTTVNMTISSLILRFDFAISATRDWLKGLPLKVFHMADVEDIEDLKKLCLEWEQSAIGSTPKKGAPGPVLNALPGRPFTAEG